MSKQKYRDRTHPNLSVKKRAGRRAFQYQIPPEVADRLPPGVTVNMVSLSGAEIYDLARRVEPEVARWLEKKPAKNALEALLLMALSIYALLQPAELPVPHREQIEIADLLAQGYDFADSWPYTRAEMQAAMIADHHDLQPDMPEEHILYVARMAEECLLLQLAEEKIALRDATQSGMLLVTMIHKALFDQSTVFGADIHEMNFIARVLIASHTFHPDWPFRESAKAALQEVYNLP